MSSDEMKRNEQNEIYTRNWDIQPHFRFHKQGKI